jgi:uncharacterized protein YdaU (DUF1376 family)
VDTWIADTFELDDAAYAAYHRLWCQCWRRGGVLPDHMESLAKLAGVSLEAFRQFFPLIRAKFAETPGGITIREVQHERRRALDQRESRRRGAESTNAKRRKQEGSLSDTLSGSLSDTLSAPLSGSLKRSLATRPPAPASPPASTSPSSPPGDVEARRPAEKRRPRGTAAAEIEQLLLAGHSLNEIGARRGYGGGNVHRVLEKLIAQGKLTPHAPHRPIATPATEGEIERKRRDAADLVERELAKRNGSGP